MAIVATTEVGAIEGVDASVVVAVQPRDVEGMATAIAETIDRLRRAPAQTRSKARTEAQRLFAPELVCEQISTALEQLVTGR